MSKFLPVLLIFQLSLSILAQDQIGIRKIIIPLVSDRSDVEHVARLLRANEDSAEYETDSEHLDVRFSKGECVRNGWNVPKDRVISYRSYPKKSFTIKDVRTPDEKFFRTASDDGRQIFINRSDGIQFVLLPGKVEIESILFLPTEADSSLRCKGFPAFDPVADGYAPYQEGEVTDAYKWDPGLIVATLGRINSDPDLKGFIFVYCRKGRERECKHVLKKIEHAADVVLGQPERNRLVVMLGGYRDRTETESFLIPTAYPPATARPFYPAND